LIERLRGRWSIERRLHDRRSGRRGTFAGTADFAPDGDRLRWSERGRLSFGTRDGPAGRELSIAPAGDGWLVAFADGRPFHALDLATGACAVEHRCGGDRYDGAYRLTGPDTLEVDWRVTGPRKDLEISTTYRRIGPAVTRPATAR
jgi:hypothetical protein